MLILTAFMIGMASGMNSDSLRTKKKQNQSEQQDKINYVSIALLLDLRISF
jgi:hypothetical protein